MSEEELGSEAVCPDCLGRGLVSTGEGKSVCPWCLAELDLIGRLESELRGKKRGHY